MRKESSAAEKRNSAFAPNLVDLTDRIRLRDGGEHHNRSSRDRSLIDGSRVRESGQDGPSAADVAKLARLIGTYAPHDGRFALGIPGVYAIRASRPYTELVHVSWQPGLCIVAQGAKRVMLGQQIYEYDESRVLVSAVEVPVAAHRQLTDQGHRTITWAPGLRWHAFAHVGALPGTQRQGTQKHPGRVSTCCVRPIRALTDKILLRYRAGSSSSDPQ